MKLLNRLRQMRNESQTEWMNQTPIINECQHLETIGIGATTYEDIVRLEVVNYPLLISMPSCHS